MLGNGLFLLRKSNIYTITYSYTTLNFYTHSLTFTHSTLTHRQTLAQHNG